MTFSESKLVNAKRILNDKMKQNNKYMSKCRKKLTQKDGNTSTNQWCVKNREEFSNTLKEVDRLLSKLIDHFAFCE